MPSPPDVDRRSWPYLPSLLFDCAVTFGLDTARRLAAKFGGQIIYVPPKAEPDHKVAREFGAELLAWLIRYHDGRLTGDHSKIVIPLGPDAEQDLRDQTIMAMTERGMKRNEIARALGIHVRTVSAARARHRMKLARLAARRAA